MIIGTVRPEEARVFDSQAGIHSYSDGPGSFEVYWHDDNLDDPMRPSRAEAPDNSGWYWAPLDHASEPTGPFASSTRARADADPNWE